MKINWMKNIIYIFFTLLLSLFISCNSESNNTFNFLEIKVTNFFIERSYPYSDIYDPLEISISVLIKNNSTSNISFGTYNHQYNQQNKSYGLFKMICKNDTADLFSRYTQLFDIQSKDSLRLNLYYQGDLLEFFRINSKEINEQDVKTIFDNIKLIYVPLAVNDTLQNYYMINKIYNNIILDTLVIDYSFQNLNRIISIAKFGNNYKILPSE